ncbi:MAG: hypothetical protein FWD13_00025 [Treponema sp.]|nr:hypothetical protein [Treponema sp.]
MKNRLIRKAALPFLLIAVLLLGSCIGISFDIQMNRDGSSRVTIEYRISNMLNALGRLDGNESMPTIPYARQDLERSLARIPGSRLVSYSSRETAMDTVIRAVVDFTNPDALAAFLNSNSDNISVTYNGQTGYLGMIINNDQPDDSAADTMALMRQFFDGYNFDVSFSAPGNSTMTVTDGQGNTIPAPANIVTTMSGRKVSLSMGIFDLLNINNGLGVRFNW